MDWILKLHAHFFDSTLGSPLLRKHLGGKIAIGGNITQVCRTFSAHLPSGLQPLPTLPVRSSSDGEQFAICQLQAQASRCLTSPACMAYQVGDAVFVGDTLSCLMWVRHAATSGGNAHILYQSIRKLLSLPQSTRLFMCHDYPPEGRDVQWECTVADQRMRNIHVHDGGMKRNSWRCAPSVMQTSQ